MNKPLRVIVALALLTGGMAMVGYAGYHRYVALPEEHTVRRGTVRLAPALGRVALVLLGSRFLF